MKRFFKSLVFQGAIITFLIAAGVVYVYAVYSIGSKTNVDAPWKVTRIQQTALEVGSKADIFAAQPISSYSSWALWVKNEGSAALTDLDILIHYENANWDDAIINMTDAQPFASDTDIGCVVNLATDTVCLITYEQAAPLGWIKAQAAAGSATTVTVTFVGRVN